LNDDQDHPESRELRSRQSPGRWKRQVSSNWPRPPLARSLIGLFLNDQELKKKAKAYDEVAKDVKQAAVLGAGIMGGGIAYQSASKGTPILMKDINEHGIEQGLAEAAKLLVGRVDKGRMTAAKMAEVLNGIRPTLSYGDFGHVDLVVEAVVENPKVKQAVLAEVEAQVKDDTILASNTSTISITLLAKALKRPENFVGMHFFNPVHMMPLVEVIRGEKSSELAVATTRCLRQENGQEPDRGQRLAGFWSTACCSRTSAVSPSWSAPVWTLCVSTR